VAKVRTVHVCSECGHVSGRWEGRCAECGAWNSYVEEVERAPARAAGPGSGAARAGRAVAAAALQGTLPLSEVDGARQPRLRLGIGELDRVLGGGVVRGSLVLISGDPGIGKSTLLLQLCAAAADGARQRGLGGPVGGMGPTTGQARGTPHPPATPLQSAAPANPGALAIPAALATPAAPATPATPLETASTSAPAAALYISGEESLHQIRMRADRLGLPTGSIHALATNDLDEALAALENLRPAVAVLDSVQTVSDPNIASATGSVAQVREVAQRVMAFCKRSGTAVFLVGHVNKEGAVAGPKVLEHLVDAVLQLEGEAQGQLRLLRGQKNRFGSTDELGVFEMAEEGLREAADPARSFYDEASLGAPGTAVFPALEGSRPLLVEIQSLVGATPFGLPRRSATGVELNRLHMLLAVLEKRAGLQLASQDVYVNVVGGVRLSDPAADLALALSVAGSLRDGPLPRGLVVAGEMGLAGEVRDCRRLERRLGEAARLGFTRALVGRRAAESLGPVPGIAVTGVGDIREAVAACFK
jgi:DNA repair protein RadA/Sms